MKKRVIKIILVAVVLLIVCLVIAANYMVSMSLIVDRAQFFQEDELYDNMRKDYPQTVNWLDSMQQNHLLRDTFVVSKVDGSKLHAVYAYAKKPTNKTVVLVHGYTDCTIMMLPIGYMYNNDLGFNILAMDHHAHGLSEGEAIQMGWLDRLDVLNWMKVAHDIFSTPEAEAELVVHGVSMGAATTMCVSGEVEGRGPAAQLDWAREILPMPYVKCFVEDCGYTSVWDEFSSELKKRYGLPSFPLMNIASWVCDFRYGWNFTEASPQKMVSLSSLPMFFIHGDVDTFVPTDMIYKVHEAKPEPKEIWLTPGVPHALSYQMFPMEYTQKVKEFTDKYM